MFPIKPLTSEGCAGANGLAAARDFLTPVARFEERECDFTVLHKFNGQLFQAEQVSWRSSAYAPSKIVCSSLCPESAGTCGSSLFVTWRHEQCIGCEATCRSQHMFHMTYWSVFGGRCDGMFVALGDQT